MKPLTDKINYFLAFSETEIDETVLKSSDMCVKYLHMVSHQTFVSVVNNAITRFSRSKSTQTQRTINELTILIINSYFTVNQASQRPKVQLFWSLVRSPRPQKIRRGKPQRILGGAIMRMYKFS